MGCDVYLVVSLYVRGDRVLLRAVRGFESLGGRVVFVDEDSRRVVANVRATRVDDVERLISYFASGYTVNVKASCSAESLSLVEGRVRGLRYVRVVANTYYASVNGRIVEVNFRGGGRVDVKIGVRSSLVAPVPPSVFNMDLRAAREALGELPVILDQLGLGGGVSDRG